MTQNSKKQIKWFVSFSYSPELLSSTLFSQLWISEEIAKSKSINLISYFNTLTFKFSRFKMNFGIVSKKLFRRQMISAVAETSGAYIDEVKFQYWFFKVTKFLQEWKIWPKKYFLVFALFVGNFSNKHHYKLLKILRVFYFWYFCPKWLFPKLFVLKVYLCIKVVALIKITSVFYMIPLQFLRCLYRSMQYCLDSFNWNLVLLWHFLERFLPKVSWKVFSNNFLDFLQICRYSVPEHKTLELGDGGRNYFNFVFWGNFRLRTKFFQQFISYLKTWEVSRLLPSLYNKTKKHCKYVAPFVLSGAVDSTWSAFKGFPCPLKIF